MDDDEAAAPRRLGCRRGSRRPRIRPGVLAASLLAASTLSCEGYFHGPDARPDGDADGDADLDSVDETDADGDLDGAEQPDGEGEVDCPLHDFPNGGACDPLSGQCCRSGEACQVDYSTGCVETCVLRTGSLQLGESCYQGSSCLDGMTCVNGLCVLYCFAEDDSECPPGTECHFFPLPPLPVCDHYGVCLAAP